MNKLKPMSDAEYHQRTGVIWLTSGLLRRFRSSPAEYQARINGLVPNVTTPAMVLGSAVHTLVLEPDTFIERYQIGGPINDRTGKEYGASTKKFKEFAATCDKIILSRETATHVNQMARNVWANPETKNLLHSGLAEHVIEHEIASGLMGQSRPDYFRPGHLIDLKTCQSLDTFESSIAKWEYVHQLAYYAWILRANDYDVTEYTIIAVESSLPYRCGVWSIMASTINTATQENRMAIESLLRCRKSDLWPTGYEITRVYGG